MGDAAREPPPDLSSFLLQNRIVYLGMPLQQQVTELLLAQLMYLNYNNPEQPVQFYINSTGTSKEGQLAYDPEAFAVYDAMQFIEPKIHTLCVGTAWGEAAMLLAAGEQGHRAALPAASIMIKQPLGQNRGQASDLDLTRHELRITTCLMIETLARHTGRGEKEIATDIRRPRYMDAHGAIDYGLCDSLLDSKRVSKFDSGSVK